MSTPYKITPLKFFSVALLILGALVVVRYWSLPTDDYGYARDSFLRDTISFGSCGLAALISIFTGVFLLRAIRASRVHPLLAIVVFISIAIGAAFIPFPLIPFVAEFWSDRTLFSGDNGFMILFAHLLSAVVSGVAVFGFLVAVCFFRRPPKHHEIGA